MDLIRQSNQFHLERDRDQHECLLIPGMNSNDPIRSLNLTQVVPFWRFTRVWVEISTEDERSKNSRDFRLHFESKFSKIKIIKKEQIEKMFLIINLRVI